MKDRQPWMVPSAIQSLNNLLRADDVVLEFGSGGSTLFFTDRCEKVLSFETSSEWFDNVHNHVTNNHNKKLLYCHVQNQTDMVSVFDWISKDQITVVSIDTVHGFDRSELLNQILFGEFFNLRLIILDNYASESLFPIHYSWNDVLFLDIIGNDWKIYTFDDKHWHGSGTKLFVKTPIF